MIAASFLLFSEVCLSATWLLYVFQEFDYNVLSLNLSCLEIFELFESVYSCTSSDLGNFLAISSFSLLGVTYSFLMGLCLWRVCCYTWCLDLLISATLSSSLLIFSPTCSNLLLSPSIEIFISIIMFYSCRIFAWFIFIISIFLLIFSFCLYTSSWFTLVLCFPKHIQDS